MYLKTEYYNYFLRKCIFSSLSSFFFHYFTIYIFFKYHPITPNHKSGVARKASSALKGFEMCLLIRPIIKKKLRLVFKAIICKGVFKNLKKKKRKSAFFSTYTSEMDAEKQYKTVQGTAHPRQARFFPSHMDKTKQRLSKGDPSILLCFNRVLSYFLSFRGLYSTSRNSVMHVQIPSHYCEYMQSFLISVCRRGCRGCFCLFVWYFFYLFSLVFTWFVCLFSARLQQTFQTSAEQ